MLLKSLFALTLFSPFISTDARAGSAENYWSGPTVSAPAALLAVAGAQEARAGSAENYWSGPTVSAPAALLAVAGAQEARAELVLPTGEATVRAPAALLAAAGAQEARAELVLPTGETTVRAPAAHPAADLDQGADPGSPFGHYLVGLLLSGVALVAGRRA